MEKSRFQLGDGWSVEMTTHETIRIRKDFPDTGATLELDISRQKWDRMVHFLTVEYIEMAKLPKDHL